MGRRRQAQSAAQSDPQSWGADAIFTIVDHKLVFQSYYKLPAPQTKFENCVAHNGSLIPIPGRDVMVQAWYQGGISVFDWTDAKHPTGDRVLRPRPDRLDAVGQAAGPGPPTGTTASSSSSEIARGLDIFELDAERA